MFTILTATPIESLVLNFTEILGWVVDELALVIAAVVANPLILLFVVLGLAGLILGFAKSFLHF